TIARPKLRISKASIAPHPSVEPTKPPISAPATPSAVVITMPPGSSPGMTSFASAPAISPKTIHESSPISSLLSPFVTLGSARKERESLIGVWTPNLQKKSFEKSALRHVDRERRLETCVLKRWLEDGIFLLLG